MTVDKDEPSRVRADLLTRFPEDVPLLNEVASDLLDEGDTIAFPTPYWTSYLDIAEIVNAKIDLLPCPPEQDYKLTTAQLDDTLTKRFGETVLSFTDPDGFEWEAAPSAG